MAAGIDSDFKNSVNSSIETGSSCYFGSSVESADEEVVYIEETVEEDGEQEIVLTPAVVGSPVRAHQVYCSWIDDTVILSLSLLSVYLLCWGMFLVQRSRS